MGANINTRVFENVNKTVATSTANIMTNISQTNESISSIVQEVNVEINGTFSCAGKLTLSNTAETSVKSISQISSEQTADLQAQVMSDYSTAVKKELEMEQEGFNLGQLNINTDVDRVINETIADTTTNIVTTLNNTIRQSATTTQVVTFVVGQNGEVSIDGDCTFSNEATVKLVGQNIAENVTNVIQASKAYNDTKVEYDNAVIQNNKGLKPGSIIIIVIVVIVVIIIIAIIAKFAPKWAKKKKTKK